jgi:hypothetical protein
MMYIVIIIIIISASWPYRAFAVYLPPIDITCHNAARDVFRAKRVKGNSATQTA